MAKPKAKKAKKTATRRRRPSRRPRKTAARKKAKKTAEQEATKTAKKKAKKKNPRDGNGVNGNLCLEIFIFCFCAALLCIVLGREHVIDRGKYSYLVYY